MNLSAAKLVVFLISLILVLMGLLTFFGLVPIYFTMQPFWLALAGWGLLALGNLVKGL